MLLQGVEIDGLAPGTELADDLQLGQRRQHPVRDRLEPDNGGIAPAQMLDQHVFIGDPLAFPEPGTGIGLQQDAAQHRMGTQRIGRNTELLDHDGSPRGGTA